MNKQMSVIIPNWNGEDLLGDCLKSLQNQTFKNFEVILIDNGSTDQSVEFVSSNFPEVQVVRLKKNFGFATAVNVGVSKSQAKYVVFLNNDTAVDKNWLQQLVLCAREHNKVVSINSKLLNYFDRHLIDGMGIEINELGQARSIGWGETDRGQYENPFYIFGATAGASLFDRQKFIDLGMFDESYFMYSEEVDFAFRANFAGFKSIYCPKAIVFHKHKATANKLPQHIEYWQFKNMYQTIIKNYPLKLIIKNFRWLKILLVYFNTIIYQLRMGFVWPPIMTTWWLLFHLPGLIYERWKVQKSIKCDLDFLESFIIPKKITFWGYLR